MFLVGSKIFARITEELLVSLERRKQCRKQLDPDPFDGQVYSIDEFYRNSMQFFDRPGEFFRDFAGPEAPNLREADHNIAGSRLNGLARLYLFDSPILTDYPENNHVPFKWFRGQRQRSTILLFAP